MVNTLHPYDFYSFGISPRHQGNLDQDFSGDGNRPVLGPPRSEERNKI